MQREDAEQNKIILVSAVRRATKVMNEDFVLPAIASLSSYMRKGLFDNELAKYEEEDLLSDVDSQPDAPEHAGDEE